jgi:hypothetical protein
MGSQTVNRMRSQTANRVRRTHRLAAASVALLAIAVSACGGGTPAASGNTNAIKVATPSDPVEGCTYTVNGQISQDLPTGKNPHFAAFTPDPSAYAALNSIKKKGGSGAVDNFMLPAGTKLRSGPSSSAPVVGTVAAIDQLQLFEPIVWTGATGQEWLATFLACGGSNLYWVGMNDLQNVNPAAAASIKKQLAHDRAAPPVTKTDMVSDLPIVISSSDRLNWKDKSVAFGVARGEIISGLT